MQKIDIKQYNNLITGNCLSIEIPSTSDDRRAFISIGSYRYDENGRTTKVSKFLSDKDNVNTLFWLRKHEVNKEYIENDWDVCQDELINAVYIKDINFEALVKELSKFLDDFSGLDVSWKCDDPMV